MKKSIVFIVGSLFFMTSCVTTQGGSGSSVTGQSFSGTVSNTGYKTFSFNSGAVPPHALLISSYLPYGGAGAQFSGYPVVYPSIIIKDASGKAVSARLISQTAVPPSMFSSLHMETKWQVQLRPNTNYVLQVKAGSKSGHVGTKYTNEVAVGSVPVPIHVNAELNAASSGSVEIKLN